MMFYKRLREVDVPEMMAASSTKPKGKPWKFYRDMTRQLWDEARHAMMGEVGFASLGIDWPNKLAVNWSWSLNLNTQLGAKERHAVLFFIEQGLMPKTGKRYEWEVGVMSKNQLAALFQDYDWADEVLHARIGRDHYVPQFATPKEAIATAISAGPRSSPNTASTWSRASRNTATGGPTSTAPRASTGASSPTRACWHTTRHTKRSVRI
jgi:hypothetical protein